MEIKLAVFKGTDDSEISPRAFQRWLDVIEQLNENQKFSPAGFTL